MTNVDQKCFRHIYIPGLQTQLERLKSCSLSWKVKIAAHKNLFTICKLMTVHKIHQSWSRPSVGFLACLSCSWVQVPPSHLWVEFRFHLCSPRFISSTHLACMWDQSVLACLLPHAEPHTVSLVLLRLVLMLCFVSPVYPPTNQLLPSRHHVTCWTFTCRLLLLLVLLPEIKTGKVGRLESRVLWHSLTHTSENSSIR